LSFQFLNPQPHLLKQTFAFFDGFLDLLRLAIGFHKPKLLIAQIIPDSNRANVFFDGGGLFDLEFRVLRGRLKAEPQTFLQIAPSPFLTGCWTHTVLSAKYGYHVFRFEFRQFSLFQFASVCFLHIGFLGPLHVSLHQRRASPAVGAGSGWSCLSRHESFAGRCHLHEQLGNAVTLSGFQFPGRILPRQPPCLDLPVHERRRVD
jgi:hypothetical protein